MYCAFGYMAPRRWRNRLPSKPCRTILVVALLLSLGLPPLRQANRVVFEAAGDDASAEIRVLPRPSLSARSLPIPHVGLALSRSMEDTRDSGAERDERQSIGDFGFLSVTCARAGHASVEDDPVRAIAQASSTPAFSLRHTGGASGAGQVIASSIFLRTPCTRSPPI